MCPSGRYPTSWKKSALQPAFDVLDSDRDGKISADDLKTFYAARSAGAATEADIGSMMTVADLDKDGFVEFDEFERVVGDAKSSVSSASAVAGLAVTEEMFRVMDRDGDGKVGFGDLKAYMAWAGLAVTDEDIRAMIRIGGGRDDETDGGVSYEGFVRIITVDFAA
ncbi:hypothetical protein H6P81_002314 [Aristolochia fimbriata]|uniref:EF-hand domain-containing protein n=1 Tax=Aristolochia fimbriata TaxID=158543 RepID=A0AAV7FAK7_ARIFI|nr:hypothetical protein H6P81_002314 [Aristolochia fimbriata]